MSQGCCDGLFDCTLDCDCGNCEKPRGFGEAARCPSCPLLPDRYVICTRDCAVAERDADLRDRVAWFSVVTGARDHAQEIADLCSEARDERDALLAAVRGLLDAEFVARFDGAWDRLEEQAKKLEPKP